MKLVQRLGYYAGGFIIGLFLLFFFLGGKKTSCDYSPNSRVLKNIRIKNRTFSKLALTKMKEYDIDSADVSSILLSGNVDFSNSNTDLDSCKTYLIEGSIKEKNIGLLIENCDSIARINSLKIIQ